LHTFPDSSSAHVSLNLCILTLIPSSGPNCPRWELPQLRLYYESVRLPDTHDHILSFSDCLQFAAYAFSSLLKNTIAADNRISQVPINSRLISYRGLRPRKRNCALTFNEHTFAAFQYMKTVGLFDMENYGAQYLHLRCGLTSPVLRLH